MNYDEFVRRWDRHGVKDDPLVQVISKHTQAEGAEAGWWASRIHSHAFMFGYEVYSRSKDINALVTLDRAVRDIQKVLDDDAMTSLAFKQLLSELGIIYEEEILKHRHIETVRDGDEDSLSNAGGDFTHDMRLLYLLEERANSIRTGIKRTISFIEESPLERVSASKINERGISLVDAARFMWCLATDKEAPSKDLNPASKFGEFLADVFAAIGETTDPRSTFRAWARERGDWSLDPPE
ncbi:hypothetical protein LGQ03_13420 [Loktanella sp. TSTF-M6]|uniref:HEPN AbiU2-like domain-containing protein n=1 Tax=Loktanella gaetbuli TaxID=2881335 RepID=A0ABS8BX21_9RHOB|nr:hypothetical protein [Loktanella gaetbuli]MCB5200244.1 hypothetical protein [Loktanella gaetbuli]